MANIDHLIRKGRRALGKDRLPAVLGNGSGNPRTGDGKFWVRKIEAGGRFSLPIALPLAAGLAMNPKEGMRVKIGWDENENQVIYPPGTIEMNLNGVNAYAANPLDQTISDWVKTSNLTPFLCIRHPDTVNKPLTVIVFVPLIIKPDDTVILPTVLEADFSGNVPGAGLRGYAVVFWLDDNTLEVQYSTPISTADPLTNADIEETIAAATAGALPDWAWVLQDDQSELTADPAKNVDLRQFVNMPGSGGGTMSSFTLAADTGTPATVEDGETVTMDGGNGIATSISGNTVTFDLVVEYLQDQVAAFLAAGANITLTYNDPANTLTIAVSGLTSAQISDFSEAVDDRVAVLAVAGANISITYNDGANTLTFAVTGLTSAQISDFSEAVDDRVATLAVAGVDMNITYDDSGNTLTFNNVGYWHKPVRIAALANVNIASAPSSINFVTLSSGDRILLTAQSMGSQNGIWVFNGTGNALTRPTDYAAGSTILAYANLFVLAYDNSTSQDEYSYLWRLTTTGTITIDTTSTSWVRPLFSIENGGMGFQNFPAGSVLIGGGGDFSLVQVTPAGDGYVLTSVNGGADWLAPIISDLAIFGDGADGDATITGAQSLTRDMYYNDLTIQSGAVITTNGYRVFVNGTLDVTAAPAGWLKNNGNNAVTTTGATALASAAVGGAPAGASTPAGTGAVGNAGNAGDAGGASGAGGRSGNQAGVAASVSPSGFRIGRATADLIKGVSIVLGGSSAGSGSTGTNATGGGGGGGGGVIFLAARIISRGGSTAANGIQANGGNGGPGTVSGGANGSGGGGGGGGGWVYIVYEQLTGSAAANMIQASGGTGGNGGNAATTGGTGGTGGSGGRVTKIETMTSSVVESTGGAGTAGSANSGATGGAGGTGNSFQVGL